MIPYQSDATIQSPASQVFRILTDASKYSQWTDMGDSRMVGQGTGAKIETVLKMGPWKFPTTFEVTEWEEGRKFGLKTVSGGPVSWDANFTLEPAGESATRIISTGTLGLRGWMRLLEPLMAEEVKQGEAKELERLKRLVEGGA
ncbi:MAG: SRPBCC family protein [Chloroflexi bacterium]|nr:SRPBCC family protein [Chloroflexota bacterium]